MPAVNNKSKRPHWGWQGLPALVCYAIKIMREIKRIHDDGRDFAPVTLTFQEFQDVERTYTLQNGIPMRNVEQYDCEEVYYMDTQDEGFLA